MKNAYTLSSFIFFFFVLSHGLVCVYIYIRLDDFVLELSLARGDKYEGWWGIRKEMILRKNDLDFSNYIVLSIIYRQKNKKEKEESWKFIHGRVEVRFLIAVYTEWSNIYVESWMKIYR